MKHIRFVLLAALTPLVGAIPTFATSARPVYPELVGIRDVSLNVSLTVLPGMESEGFERIVREKLEAAGLRVDPEAMPSVFVHTEQLSVPGCEDLLVIRMELAVSEDARISRPGKDPVAWVNVFSMDESYVVPRAEAWTRAEGSLLGLIDYMLDARRYTMSFGKTRR